MRAFIALLVFVGCAHVDAAPNADDVAQHDAALTAQAPDIVAGEVLVVTNDRTAIDSKAWATAAGRPDVIVRSVDCLSARICRVFVERKEGVTDVSWTREIIAALAASLPPGVESVEPNAIIHLGAEGS